MKIIGTRKMIVILSCVFCLTGVMLYHVSKSKDLNPSMLAGMSMVTALGGVHTYRPFKKSE